jgi:hypothetical protein
MCSGPSRAQPRREMVILAISVACAWSARVSVAVGTDDGAANPPRARSDDGTGTANRRLLDDGGADAVENAGGVDDLYTGALDDWVRVGFGANAQAANAVSNGALFRMPFGVVAVPKCYPNDCVARENLLKRTPAKGWQRRRDEILRTEAIEETRARWRDTLELWSILPMRDSDGFARANDDSESDDSELPI